MGERIEIEVSGIGPVGGWLARPDGQARGGLVVVQEIFGINAHIRAVVDDYAYAGFVALAPAFFDAVEPGVELGYTKAESLRGRELAAAVGFERAVAIVDAAAKRLCNVPGTTIQRHQVGVVGFCWGGTIAYLANTRLGLPAASYYGARTVPLLDEPLRAPMLFHFGEQDPSIPQADVVAHRQAHPDASIFTYPDAGHAFTRDVDPGVYAPYAAQLAHERTLELFRNALRQEPRP